MRIDSKFTAADLLTHPPRLPQPGEIWEVSRSGRLPLVFSPEEMQQLYSETARQFLAGSFPPRYVAIVREPELAGKANDEMAIVSVMVLSADTQFLSNVDPIVPAEISGIDRPLLAETWHVLPMLACHLSHPVGKRLSREVYDILLDVGDANLGLLPAAPSPESIRVLGLKVGMKDDRSAGIEAFHQREREWSDVLSVPLAAYQSYHKTMALAERIAEEALEVERELVPPSRSGVNLSEWLNNLFDRNWLSWESFWEMPGMSLAWSTRTLVDFHDSEHLAEIQTSIERLAEEIDEHKQRQIARKLGEIAPGHSGAITALVYLLETTQNDEVLWTAVESLWRIDPENNAAGIRRVKSIDWGIDVAGNAAALAVSVVPKSSDRFGVLLRVYPAGDRSYLPSDLKLILLDELGRVLREVTAREADIFLQLKLSGKPDEKFSVCVSLGEASITENFTL